MNMMPTHFLASKWLTWALAVAALLALATTAVGQLPSTRVAPPAAPKPTTDYRDFLFLASDRPVFLRLHLQSSGKPYYVPFDEYMGKLFANLDVANKGFLTAKEIRRVPSAQWLQFTLQGSLGFPFQQVPMNQLDTDKNGKVSPQELANYYRRNGFAPLNVFFNTNEAGAAAAVTDSFYKKLDTNGDARLSPAEVALAPAVLQRFDFDDDEMLTQEELAPERYGMNNRGRVLRQPGGRPARSNLDWLEIGLDTTPKSLAQRLLTHYDKNKDRKLDRGECGLDAATFAALDVDHDGKLSATELSRFFQRPADVELVLHTGKLPGWSMVSKLASYLPAGMNVLQARRVAVFNPDKRPMPLAAGAHAAANGALTFKLGDTAVAVNASETQFFDGFAGFFRQQFQVSMNKQGYIDRKMAQGAFPFGDIFGFCDRDGDGKLYRKELEVFLALQTQGGGCVASLAVTDEGRNLFTVFDGNNDGRLSARELRTAWTRLEPLLRPGGDLSRGDIPRHLRVSLMPNNGRFIRRAGGMARNGNNAGPVWFRKMDRNNDGDVSAREFLGTPELFRRLDTDGDGLISLVEAQRASLPSKSKQK